MSEDYGRFECEYCGREGGYPSELEIRNSKIICRDAKACQAREDAQAEEDEK